MLTDEISHVLTFGKLTRKNETKRCEMCSYECISQRFIFVLSGRHRPKPKNLNSLVFRYYFVKSLGVVTIALSDSVTSPQPVFLLNCSKVINLENLSSDDGNANENVT